MKATILVAGATGNLGGRIVKALLQRGADVRALVRKGTDEIKINELQQQGAQVIQADLSNIDELTQACTDVSCVVSALQGLRDVIVDTQTTLLNAAIATGVPRFIPSDFSADFISQPFGENRNFDLRKEFKEHLDKAPIAATTILNGAFADILAYGTPLLDVKKQTVGYWENADWHLEFTTMDDTAAYTAAVAVDDNTPRVLRIASFQVSPQQLAVITGDVKQTEFQLIRMGSLQELAAYNKQQRAAQPEGEKQLYPQWQQGQYIQSMFSNHFDNLDNDRYPEIQWTSVKDFIANVN